MQKLKRGKLHFMFEDHTANFYVEYFLREHS